MVESLLEPSFLAQLEVLRRRFVVRARSGAAGERIARRRGASAEFQDHRAYSPGDDLRRVDWLAYARTGAPVVKLFHAEEDVVVRLLIDGSRSLAYGAPSKIDVARRIAAALGYIALAGAQRAQVLWAHGAAETIRGSGLERVRPPRRGRNSLGALLRDLSLPHPVGAVDLGHAIDDARRISKRPGLLVVLSDFLDAGPVLPALGRVRSAGHDVALVHVLSRSELEPEWEGDLDLLDSETGQAVAVTLDARALAAYAKRLAQWIEELQGWARRHGASYVRANTDDPLEGTVSRLVARRID